jgi:hypothetical protein
MVSQRADPDVHAGCLQEAENPEQVKLLGHVRRASNRDGGDVIQKTLPRAVVLTSIGFSESSMSSERKHVVAKAVADCHRDPFDLLADQPTVRSRCCSRAITNCSPSLPSCRLAASRSAKSTRRPLRKSQGLPFSGGDDLVRPLVDYRVKVEVVGRGRARGFIVAPS